MGIAEKNPAVSVVIPCYKQAHFLPEALLSLQAQTFQNWECLVVDDGSPDHTASIAREWAKKDTRFRPIGKENGGRSSARNCGLREARGEFVQFLDADDLIEPLKFAWQLEVLRKNPDVGIACSDLRYFPEAAPKERRYSLFEPNLPWFEEAWLESRPILEKLLERNIIGINCPLIRSSVINKVGFFDESLNTMEDWHYWLRCATQGVVFHFSPAPDTLALVRIHPDSISQDRPEMDCGTYQMTLKIAPFLTNPGLRLKNFELGLHRMGADRAVSVDRKLLRLAWANRGKNIIKPFLCNYLSRRPRLSKLTRQLASI